MSARGFLIACVLGMSALPSIAVADVEEARDLFEQGSAALASGRFPVARDLLRRSLELHPHAATAFNLVVALRGTEQPTEASRVCDDLLAGRLGALDPERTREARALCAEVEADRGRIELVVSGAPRIEVSVDELTLGELDDGGAMTHFVDPGLHVVRASAPDRDAVERSLRVERGRAVQASLVLRPPAESGDALAWGVGLGVAGAVLAGVAIAIAVVVLTPSLPPHDMHLEI